MSEQPNPAEFSRDEKPGEYEATFRVEGEIRMTIKADSEADARAKALAEMKDECFGQEIDEVDTIKLRHVWKTRPMYRVTRDGQTMQVCTLEPGDLPRQPTEYGF